MAINIIYKDKKQIHFLGIPNFEDLLKSIQKSKEESGENLGAETVNSGITPSSSGNDTGNSSKIEQTYTIPDSEIEQITLNNKITKLKESIAKKRKILQESILQQIAIKNLVAKNKQAEAQQKILDTENLMKLAETSIKNSLMDFSSNSASGWNFLEEDFTTCTTNSNSFEQFSGNVSETSFDPPAAKKSRRLKNSITGQFGPTGFVSDSTSCSLSPNPHLDPETSNSLPIYSAIVEGLESNSSEEKILDLSDFSKDEIYRPRSKKSSGISGNKIELPFMVISAPKSANIKCNFDTDEKSYEIEVDSQQVKLLDDLDILQELGLTYNFTLPDNELRKKIPSRQDYLEAKKILPLDMQEHLGDLYEDLLNS